MNKTKRKIFEISMKLFAEKGYDATSIEDITATVGVAKGTLYYHFSSKEEIFNLLVEEGIKLLKNIIDILQGKMIKRNLSIKILDPKAPENALGGNIRQVFELKKGLTQELAKKIVAIVKDSKLKVQASIQGEQVRVSGKSRDDLQDVIKLLKEKEEVLNIPLQFTNYR